MHLYTEYDDQNHTQKDKHAHAGMFKGQVSQHESGHWEILVRKAGPGKG